MENNKTAVDWLFNKLWEEPKDRIIWQSIFEKAKAMEKEQIKNAYGQGVADEAGEILDSTKDAEEYYKEAYEVK